MHTRLFTVPAFHAFGSDLGPFVLHTYGVLLAIGFLTGLFVAAWQARKAGLDAARISDLAVYVLIAGLLGAKLMLLAVDFRQYSRKSPMEIAQAFVQSGGVFYGGLIGGLLMALWFARRYHLPLWPTADVLAPGVVIGQSIGRLGCLAAGCCWGKTATVPWAITFRDIEVARTIGTPLDTPLHPSQIYESLLTLLIFVVLIWLAPRKKFQGQVALAYVVLYSIARFSLEYFRGDAERGFLGPLSTSQWVALVLVILAGALFLRLRKLRVATPTPAAG